MKTRLAPLAAAALAASFLIHIARAEDLPDVVERVYPSAVQIHVLPKPKPPSAKPSPPGFDESLSRLMPPQTRSGSRSSGAGFVVGADGYLVTADFVIDGDSEIDVTFSNGRKFRAALAGKDRGSGIAVLKIDATGLAPLRFGDSSKLRLGERVFAIGAPYNMPGTVTDGIVSSLGREHPSLGPILFIQSSVYINPGSGGGPLFNMKGEVVGMNSHIYSSTGSFTGLSFAVPSEIIQKVVEEIRLTGKVVRGRIGISVADVPASPAGLGEGALVRDATPGDPAAAAGIRESDVIVKFGNIAVTSGNHLTRMVQWSKPGERVAIEFIREGRRQKATVVLGEQK